MDFMEQVLMCSQMAVGTKDSGAIMRKVEAACSVTLMETLIKGSFSMGSNMERGRISTQLETYMKVSINTISSMGMGE